MTVEEYLALLNAAQKTTEVVRATEEDAKEVVKEVKKAKKKVSAYTRKYKAAFRRIEEDYKLKNGNWKKNGFKRAVKAAHKLAGGKK